MSTVYVSIGNSDDKLTQREWCQFLSEVTWAINTQTEQIHGEWFSANHSPYQNACWCFEILDMDVDPLKKDLLALAIQFRQDSIAWADATTTFITPTEEPHG